MTVDTIAQMIRDGASFVAFTGAGISTESGIPDFRSPGGVWTKYQPVYFDEYMDSYPARVRYWQQKSESHVEFSKAAPNAGHVCLAKWERLGRLRGVITQNIDGLHQIAGNRHVLELHGTARRVACLACDFSDVVDNYVASFVASGVVPDCPSCGGLLKHATVSFGQTLPADALGQAADWAEQCELFLAIGSSLTVTPAADLPRRAADAGARLVIINRDATPLDDFAAEVIRLPIGNVLTAIDKALDDPE